MRSHRLLLLVASIAIVFGASALGASSPSLSPRDLPRVIDPRPAVPGWSFEAGDPWIYPTPARAPAFTLREWLGESPAKPQVALADGLRKAGFVAGRHLVWDGSRAQGEDATAVVFAFLFRSASGASIGYKALRTGVRGNLPLTRLGQEALRWHVRDGDEEARYLWRRGNLVTLAGVVCSSDCGFPVVPPARAYASQIDTRAKGTP